MSEFNKRSLTTDENCVQRQLQLSEINACDYGIEHSYGDDFYELDLSRGDLDFDDPFYEYSDIFYDDEDPFTPEERYNLDN